jgi:hypothetical protein
LPLPAQLAQLGAFPFWNEKRRRGDIQNVDDRQVSDSDRAQIFLVA